MIDLLHEKIWVESEINKGSTFFFTLPYKPVNINVAETAKIKSNRFDWTNKVILVVEDDMFSSNYITELLHDTNVTLYKASNGQTALSTFESFEVDLVLMDIRLPDISGYELTKQMKRARPTIPIIAQTAYAYDLDKQFILQSGFDEYISKPINQEILIKMIHQYLS